MRHPCLQWPMLTMFDSGNDGHIGWVVEASNLIAAGQANRWDLDHRYGAARAVAKEMRRGAK